MYPAVVYVDSDERSIDSVRENLSDFYDIITYQNPLECLEAFGNESYAFVLSKYEMIPIDGLEFFRRLNALSPRIEKLLIANDMNAACSSMDFPVVSFRQFETEGGRLIKQYLDQMFIRQSLGEESDGQVDSGFFEIVGSHQKFLDQLRYARRISNFSEPVLISGETGTGKELFARYVHNSGNRRDCPIHFVNCAAINPTLFESEFFGYKKGAFTGANADSEGHLLKANNGTLVLDEISEININLQAKFLRAIENKEMFPVGSQKVQRFDVRFIALSNRDLHDLVEKGKFREDLYYRMSRFEIKIPPLRERAEDIDMLSKYFMNKFLYKYYPDSTMKVHPDFFNALRRLGYPGNVRELENIIFKVLTKKDPLKDILCAHDLFDVIGDPELDKNENAESLKQFLQGKEKVKILEVLKQKHQNVTEAAQSLGISRQNLQYRLKKLGIQGGQSI